MVADLVRMPASLPHRRSIRHTWDCPMRCLVSGRMGSLAGSPSELVVEGVAETVTDRPGGAFTCGAFGTLSWFGAG